MKKIIMDVKRKCILKFMTALVLLSILMVSNVHAEENGGTAAGAILNSLSAMVQNVADSFDYKEVMTIYISGIDTRGEMTDKSRSDVNILATVNTRTKEIFLLNTPRDYYVPLSISNGEPDKLTHAGMYGIDVCVDTMELLYGIDIDYYLRFNFAGFTDIIDAIGGISVYSDYDFDSSNISGYHFHEGENEMDGKTALAFARERYAFSEGDRQRGKNQIHVIEGVMNKLRTMDFLDNAEELLESVSGMYQTNIPYGTLLQFGLVEYPYLEQYQIETYSVDGTGASRKPYSMSKNAYVMIPDESTVEQAKEKMAKVRGEE